MHCSGHAAIGAPDVLCAMQDNNNKRHSVIDVNNVSGRSLNDVKNRVIGVVKEGKNVLPKVELDVMVDEGKVDGVEKGQEEEEEEEK